MRVPFVEIVAAYFHERGHTGAELDAALSHYAAEVQIGPSPVSERGALALASIATCSLLAQRKAEDNGNGR